MLYAECFDEVGQLWEHAISIDEGYYGDALGKCKTERCSVLTSPFTFTDVTSIEKRRKRRHAY